MHDADTLLARVVAQAKALGIPVSPHILPQVRLNRRAVTRFGCCIRQADGTYRIELAQRLLEAPEEACLAPWPTRCSTPAPAAGTTASGGRPTPGR